MKKLFSLFFLFALSPFLVYAWNADVTIYNNTDYYITITGVGPGNTSKPIPPNESYHWDSDETFNTKSLLFWVEPNVGQPFMQGNCSFGPTAGVYVDRGWMQEQTLCMDATANEASFDQCENGGKTILAWNQFEGGGTVTLKFVPAGESDFQIQGHVRPTDDVSEELSFDETDEE